MKHKKVLSIEEAVEMLNALAAIDPAVDPYMSEEVREATYALEEKFDLDNGKLPIVELAKDCFQTIYLYLVEMAKEDTSYTISQESLERIKSMMLLVGDAALKLEAYITHTEDKVGVIFNLPEYKELQDFYLRKVNPMVTQEKIGRWVLGIGRLPFDFATKIYKPKEPVAFNPQHLYIDLDAVRSDTDYELFFIRKEGGGRFFNPRLIRNMHLITEFGFEGATPETPPQFLSINEWIDTIAHNHALSIIRKMGSTFDLFSMDRGKFKEKDLQDDLSKALMALLLASQGRFLEHHKPMKSCYDFYSDFMEFFRTAVRSYDYQKLLSYPPRENNRLGNLLLSLTHQTAKMLFFDVPGITICKPIVNQLIAEGYERDPKLHENELTLDLGKTLESDSAAVTAALKPYNNTSLRSTLEQLEGEGEVAFDPYYQKNWPNRYMDLIVSDEEIHFVRLPTPTIQKSIDHPYVIEEFKAALRGIKDRDPKAKVLLLNFQNRASWKENKRCLVLEDLNDKDDWNEMISVVSMEVDTDFYNQSNPYDEESSWKVFSEQLKEHLVENHETMFLPEDIQEKWSEKEISELVMEIHQVFFNGAYHLSRKERIAFIDLAYQFFILKLMDWTQPRVVAFTCKDGVELSNFYFAELYASLLLFNDRSIAQQERDTLNTLVFAPSLLIRERAPQTDRLERVIDTLNVIEAARHRKSAPIFRDTILTRFGRFFKTALLEGQWFY